MGSIKVERHGPQSIDLDLDAIRERFESEFGESF
jgi:hypothetical protein